MSASSPYRDEDVRRVPASVAASQTDAEVIPAESERKLRVLSVFAQTTAATALTFNRKSSGVAGTPISATFTAADGEPTVGLPYNPHGWFETASGQSLTVTTGSGQTTQLAVVAVSLSEPSAGGALLSQLRVTLLLEDNTPLLLESA